MPLVVDVDGTLLRTDLLHEAALHFVGRWPLQSWRLVGWTLGGKANLKAALAERCDLGIDQLPLRDEVVAMIRDAQAAGRPVWLASASDRSQVERLAQRVGGISGVMASDGATNLGGVAKAAALRDAFGDGGFDYLGDAAVDIAVWRDCREATVIGERLHRRVSGLVDGARALQVASAGPREYLRALRPHQWAKNLLVFLPLAAGHRLDPSSVLNAVIAFVCFCLAASSAYLLNDIFDLAADRNHPRKRNRPFAAGIIPVWQAPILSLLMISAAFVAALMLGAWFVGVLALYVVTTLAYSLALKRKVLLDVVVLGALYTARVVGGVAAVGVKQSPWLLMFSLFLFLGLAVVKRCSELVARRAEGKLAAVGRGYHVEDLGVLLALGGAAAFATVLVVALYIVSPEVQQLYRNPERLWLICPLLLYWMGRTLLLANRGAVHDDPVIFALTDRVSWATAAAGLAIATAATL